MAEFYAAVTTDAGISLSADLLTGEQIIFTRLVTGNGIYNEEEMARTSLQKASRIKEPRQEFEFSDISKETDSCILLKTLISNESLAEGYRMTEIGVYAKKKGEEGNEGDEILYSISIAKEADFLPPYNGLAAVEIIEEYYITISDAAEVSLQAGSSAAVLKEDLEKLKIELLDEVNQKLSELQKQIGNINELVTTNKGNVVDAINEVAEVIKPLIEYSFATDQDIDDIIDGIYIEDSDWATIIDIASERVIDAIIEETYTDEEENGEGIASDEDIDAIIAGTYVDEEENVVTDITDQEVNEIIDNAFRGEGV